MTDANTVPRVTAGDPGRRPSATVRGATWLLPALVYFAAVAVGFSIGSKYLQLQLALLAFWILVGMSWNLIGGYAGQLNLGHAAFIGLGAYATAILFGRHGIVPWLALPVGACAAAIAAAILGAATLRLRGLYLGLASVALPFVLQILFSYVGLQEVPLPLKTDHLTLYMEWTSNIWFAALLGGMALLFWYALKLFESTRWRIVLQALRDDQDATRSLGINTSVLKITLFVVSAAVAGVAGVVYGQMNAVISPDSVFSNNLSIEALLICLIGGLGYRGAPLVGAFVLVALNAILNEVAGNTFGVATLAYGLVLMIVVIALPRGVLPLAASRLRGVATWGRREPTVRALVEGEPAPLAPSRASISPGPVLRQGVSGGPQGAVEATGIRKVYGGVVAINDLDLSVTHGEFVGLVGPNGAGKTTLFDLLTGYQRASSGRVQMFGRDVSRWAPHRIARLGVRRSFQTSRPFGDLSVLDNVAAGALRGAKDLAEARAAAMSALTIVGLEQQVHHLARSLVPAQLRLLEVARAVACRPRMILLDEPLAGLGRAEAVELMKLLIRLREESGMTIVLVDHDIGTVADHVDKLVVLDHGSVIAAGEAGAVMQDTRVIAAYLGEGWQSVRH